MNPVYFTGKEVLDMAVKIEENGLRYYTDAAAAAKAAPLKELFGYLADQEKDHIKVFSGLRKLIADTGSESSQADYGEEAALYLNALADSEVFTNANEGARLAKTVKGEREAVEMAIGMEKDSLLFYYEIQKMIRPQDASVLEHLIGQEKDHVRRLTAYLKTMGKK
ncbi:MAG: ferritin family protein [Deltaproteobacteria bacterium]|nr:ferritin family protein [Deltaproteobacteria bacterium]